MQLGLITNATCVFNGSDGLHGRCYMARRMKNAGSDTFQGPRCAIVVPPGRILERRDREERYTIANYGEEEATAKEWRLSHTRLE